MSLQVKNKFLNSRGAAMSECLFVLLLAVMLTPVLGDKLAPGAKSNLSVVEHALEAGGETVGTANPSVFGGGLNGNGSGDNGTCGWCIGHSEGGGTESSNPGANTEIPDPERTPIPDEEEEEVG